MSKYSEQKATVLSDEEEKQYQKDGLENLLSGLGTGNDKRTYSRFTNNKLLSHAANRDELDALYRTDWLAGKVVDIIPDDMTREWRQFTSDVDPEIIQDIVEEEERIDLSGNFNLAHKWARLYGTAFIIMSIDDGQEPDKPLDIEKLKPGCLRHIKVLDRYHLNQGDTQVNIDPMSKNFGMPDFYRMAHGSVRIHHSRVLRFDGVRLPYDRFRENNYCSDSVLSRLYDALTNLVTTSDGAASMVYETNVDVFKVKGLMNYLQTQMGEDLIRKRFTLASMMKSFNNSLLLDSEEDYINKTASFSGIPELIDRFALFISAASDIPATRLLGSSASGLNATGEGDLKNYYDTVRSMQKKVYKPLLDYIDQILAKHLDLSEDADGKNPLKYEFESLFQMTPKEEADMSFVNAQRDAIYLDRDVVPLSCVAKELKQNDVYTNLDDDYIDELEEFENEVETDPIAVTPGEQEEEQGGAQESTTGGQEPQTSGGPVSEGADPANELPEE